MERIDEAIEGLTHELSFEELEINGRNNIKTALAALRTMKWVDGCLHNTNPEVDKYIKLIQHKFTSYLKG